MSSLFIPTDLVVPFELLRMTDVESVGGKNASLGEMISNLPTGVKVPTGFATTAHAFREFLKFDGLTEKISAKLKTLDVEDVRALAQVGAEIRALVEAQPFPPELEKGIREALHEGVIAGYPVQDVRAIATDGKYHPVDSKEIAFITAGREAFLDAIGKAKPIVPEPITNLEVRAPADCVGAITGDLSSRRGRIVGTDAGSQGMSIISAQVPQAELEGYESQLKSMTGGLGSYNIELSHYDPAPGDIQQKLHTAYKKQLEN